MTVKIAYFSGTGCTRYVSEVFRNELEARGCTVRMFRIGRDTHDPDKSYDLLILCYAVHACNPPKPVVDWIAENTHPEGLPAAVISVSGGGEVTPNLACRVLAKRKLVEKRLFPFYEKMIVMPSNWIVPTGKAAASELMRILPGKVSFCVSEILDSVPRVSFPGWGNRLISGLALLEHQGASLFGKRIRVGVSCSGCGLCAKLCPVGNIEIRNNKPVFSGSCTLCLQCLYGCPEKALTPGIMKFILIKEGFNFKNFSVPGAPEPETEAELMNETGGLLWLGVRRYLLEKKDTLEPRYKGAGPGAD